MVQTAPALAIIALSMVVGTILTFLSVRFVANVLSEDEVVDTEGNTTSGGRLA